MELEHLNLLVAVFLGVFILGFVIIPVAKSVYNEYTCERETVVVTGIKSTSWSGTVYETNRGDIISNNFAVGDSFSRCVQ